jgi:hypothetical protein
MRQYDIDEIVEKKQRTRRVASQAGGNTHQDKQSPEEDDQRA